jgi:hypothetical protein
VLVRQRLPDAERQRLLVPESVEDAQRSQPAVLVMDGRDAARVRDPDPSAAGLDHLVLGGAGIRVAEVPGALLAQDAGRLAGLVPLDDAARHLELAVREREGGRVEPERVVVLRHERGGDGTRDRVEVGLRRLHGRRPVAAPPAEAAQPAPLRCLAHRGGNPGERLVERLGSFEPHLALRQRPRREVDVRVREARQDAAPAEVDALGARERRLVGADTARDPVAGDRQRRRPG